jgi:hypothetical protein
VQPDRYLLIVFALVKSYEPVLGIDRAPAQVRRIPQLISFRVAFRTIFWLNS